MREREPIRKRIVQSLAPKAATVIGLIFLGGAGIESTVNAIKLTDDSNQVHSRIISQPLTQSEILTEIKALDERVIRRNDILIERDLPLIGGGTLLLAGASYWGSRRRPRVEEKK